MTRRARLPSVLDYQSEKSLFAMFHSGAVQSRSVLALAGGVGGAKLAHGLYSRLPANALTVVVNTGDDFDHFGLRICPDADTVTYTLAGIANPATGWGIAGDTFETLQSLGRYGEATWFQIGDRDFATHIARTRRLRAGESLSSVTEAIARSLGVRARVLPMCDQPVSTVVDTPEGPLEFQDYFVRRHHQDEVRGIRLRGIETATPVRGLADVISAATAIVLCPSNPIVSIGPILSVPGLRPMLRSAVVPRVAVSPIIGGRALRGPADRMLAGLGHEVSAFGVAELYRDFLDGIVVDRADAALEGRIEDLGVRVLVTDTVMDDDASRARLATETLVFCESLPKRSRA
jgi:LPPG:FO 2-phospho-L-lactate transferase